MFSSRPRHPGKGSAVSTNNNLRRLAAGAGTAVMAVGFAAAFGVTEAAAAPVSQSTNSGQWTFNRTISNGTPAPGETITVTNDIRWNGGLAPTISALKDIHPTCLAYVPNSSRVNGNGVGTTTPDATTVSMNGSWIRSAVDRNISYTVQYTVGADCARDTALTTGAGVNSNQGLGSTNTNTGPNVSVTKDATQTTLDIGPAPQATKVSTLRATVTNGATGTVEFSNNGTVLGTSTVSNGIAVYSWTPAAGAAGQSFSITAKYLGDATRAASTSAAQTGTVTAAPTAPAAPAGLTATPATVTAGDTVTISGTAETASSVTVTAGDKTCTATADQARVFSCDITTTAAGTLTVTAVATNGIGASPASAPITVTVAARPAPDAPTGLTANPAAVTAGDIVTISGTAEAASSVTVTAGDKTCTATADQAGAFHCDISTTAAGTLTVTAVATNSVGASPASAPITVTVAAPPAGTAVIALTPISPRAGTSVIISVIGADANSPVVVKNGADTLCTATANAGGTATCTWTPTEGTHTLTADVTVDGTASTVTKTVTVSAATDPGNPNEGSGSLAGLFGSS